MAALNKPRIMVLFRRELRKNQWVNFLSEFHLQMLVDHGAIPVPVPIVRGVDKLLPYYFQESHGLLMVEGDDIDPQFYRPVQETLHLIRETSPLKDMVEMKMARYALRNKMPILGICRGSQLLNVMAGGQLYNDVQTELPSEIDHRSSSVTHDFEHKVQLVPKTPLYEWYDRRKELNVNSYHHQGVRKLAKRFRPMCHSEDGLVEGFYDPKASFIMGLQFHPERMIRDYNGNRLVYQNFIEATREHMFNMSHGKQPEEDLQHVEIEEQLMQMASGSGATTSTTTAAAAASANEDQLFQMASSEFDEAAKKKSSS